MLEQGPSKNLTRRTMDALMWMFLGTGAQAFLHLLPLVVLARLLTPSEFGVVGAALVIVNFSAAFSDMGVGSAIVQREHLRDAHLRTGFTVSVLLGLLVGGVVVGLASPISSLLHIESLARMLPVLALSLPIRGVGLVAESLLRRELRFREIASIQVVSYALGYGAVGLGMALLDYGVCALVAAHLTQSIALSLLFLARQAHPKAPQVDPTAAAELLYFGSGLTAASLANTVANQGDRLVVARWLGAAALGLYERAHQFISLPAVLFGRVFSQVLFPAMAQVQSDAVRLERAFRRAVTAIALLAMPAMALASVVAPELIGVVLGSDWDEVILPFRIMVPMMLLATVNKMSDSVARATGAVYRRAWRQAIFAGLVVGGSWIGQHWGLPGAAAGTVAALALNFLLMAHLSLALVGMSWLRFASTFVPGVVLGTITLIGTYGIAAVVRGAGLPAIFTLVLCGVAACLSVWLAARWIPELALSDDGRWLVRTLSERLPRKWVWVAPVA